MVPMDHFINFIFTLHNYIFSLKFSNFYLALGTKCDNFVACTNEVFDWPKRRFRMLHEMVRYSPDIICLQVGIFVQTHFNLF